MTTPEDGPGANDPVAEDEIASTPFDNPFFLPVVLAGFSLWLFYDGYLNAEFIQRNIAEGDDFALAFNQWGGPILGALALWFGFKAYRGRHRESPSE